MDVVQRAVPAQRPLRAAVIEEMPQLGPGRIFGRAQEARHREGAAGVRPGGAGREALSAQPPAQETGHEGVAGAENVEHLDRKALADDSAFQALGDRPVVDDAPQRAALQDDGRAGLRADGAQRVEHAVGARGDHDLFFGADDQIAIGEHRVEPRRHRLGLHVAREARLVAGESPQVRPIVDVEHDFRAVPLGQRDGLRLRRGGVRLGEVGPRHDDGARARDQRFVDVAFVQRHVGAVGAIEDRRRNPLGLHGEQHQAAQPVFVGVHPVDGDAFADQLFADEAAHLFGADARDQRRSQPEPRRADGDVGGAAAHGLGEACDVLEPAADLLAVKVDGRAADRDQIERLVSGGAVGHVRLPSSSSASAYRSFRRIESGVGHGFHLGGVGFLRAIGRSVGTFVRPSKSERNVHSIFRSRQLICFERRRPTRPSTNRRKSASAGSALAAIRIVPHLTM